MGETATAAHVTRCFLCGGKPDRVVWIEHGIRARLCNCGVLHSDKEEAPKFVTQPIDLHPDWFYARPARLKARWMAAHCPGGKVLEVGCGEGSFLSAAREFGYEIAGIEPDPDRAARTSALLGIPIECAFIEEDTLLPGAFDVVYHCDLLAHFSDPLRAFASMARLLKPDGVLCFEAGVLAGISTFWYRLIRELGLVSHRYLYSHRALDLLIERAGLDVLHRTDFGLAPAVLAHIPMSIFTRCFLTPVFAAARAESFHQWVHTALRYYVGRVFPCIGPEKAWFVARPRVRRG